MPSKPVARIGDREIKHCSVPFRKGHFKTVFANGKNVSGDGHMNTPHKKPCACPVCCCMHSFPLKALTQSVFCEGIKIGRVGDPTCTMVEKGSPDVFAG